MLLKDFYKVESITQSGADLWKATVSLNPAHAVYEGHFPGQPVLPGVCTLQIIKEVLSAVLHTPLHYKQVGSCKFIAAIDPNKEPLLDFIFTVKEETGQWQIKVDGEAGGQPFIKLKAVVVSKPTKR